jgi:hypothetical protein
LDRVVGVESVRDSMLTVVVFPLGYFDFISYAVTSTSLFTIGPDRRGLSPYIASWIWGRVSMDVSSIGHIVGGIASDISRGVCWSISY